MRELTVEEMEQVAGGGLEEVALELAFRYFLTKAFDLSWKALEALLGNVWENREKYLQYIAKYGSGAANYQLACHFASN